MAHRSKKVNEFLRARLSAESFVGLHLTVGLLALAAAVSLFVAIAEDVWTGDDLTLLDARINVWLHAYNTTQMTKLLLLVTNLHSNWIVATVTLAICAYLWFRHLRYWLLTFALSVYGGILLNHLLKKLFVRPRPHFDDPILILNTFSFPSGHTMLAAVFYGTVCAFVVSRLRVWKLRVPAILLAIFMIALVGFTRMYLGVHYLSDVLGAMAEGLAWVAVSFLTVGMLRHWRSRRRDVQ